MIRRSNLFINQEKQPKKDLSIKNAFSFRDLQNNQKEKNSDRYPFLNLFPVLTYISINIVMTINRTIPT